MGKDEGPRLQWKINESGGGVKWTRTKNIKERWNKKWRKTVKKNAESYKRKKQWCRTKKERRKEIKYKRVSGEE